MDAQRLEMMTRDGVRVTRTAAPFDPAELGRIAARADERRGGVMSSGMEYPGRYSRWHMAYADPCAEIVAAFLAGGIPSDQELDAIVGGSQRDLRGAAQLIASAAAAWRMPDLHSACPVS